MRRAPPSLRDSTFIPANPFSTDFAWRKLAKHFTVPVGGAMQWITKYCAIFSSVVFASLWTTDLLPAQSNQQLPSFGVCKPVSERTAEIGCWILVDQPVGQRFLTSGALFRESAEFKSQIDNHGKIDHQRENFADTGVLGEFVDFQGK